MIRAAVCGTAVALLLAACGDKGPAQRLDPSASPGTTPAPSVSTSTTAPPEAIAWLKANAIPFTTSKAGSGFADLQPLKKVIGDARIVALGEATHGTREFFEMKHRLLEFLVVEMGFNTFAIEANWPEANLINEYVMTGHGDRKQILSALYIWPWQTEEVLDMIEWMRHHNENPGAAPKVSFHGFDMQGPQMAIQNVLDYLGRIDREARRVAEQRYACFTMDLADYATYSSRSSIERAGCHNSVQAVYWELESNQAGYEKATSEFDFARALQDARVVLQGEGMYAAGTSPAGFQARDRAMAENFTWLLEQAGPEAKIVLWAHNGHVSDQPGAMGSHLRKTYTDQMVIVGFDFYEGSFRAVDWGADGKATGRGVIAHTVGPPPKDSYEAFFATVGLPRMIVDLRGVRPGRGAAPTVVEWFQRLHRMRFVGAVYSGELPERFLTTVELPDLFDVVIYFETTTASVPALP